METGYPNETPGRDSSKDVICLYAEEAPPLKRVIPLGLGQHHSPDLLVVESYFNPVVDNVDLVV